MERNMAVKRWIEDLPKRGRIAFSIDEVKNQFPDLSKRALQSLMCRLVSKGQVCSVWKNYYVVIPAEYALRGTVPPIEYIDNLMKHLGHEYYVGLLNAAALYGSSHQQPQSFMVISNSKDIKSKISHNINLRFFIKSYINDEFIQRKNASYGEINISNPVMTALDLVMYENRIGGLERIAAVLDGLADELNIVDSNPALWNSFPIPVVQRLGYIMEIVLGYSELGEAIYKKICTMGNGFRKNHLDPRLKQENTVVYPYDSRWKLYINTILEVEQ